MMVICGMRLVWEIRNNTSKNWKVGLPLRVEAVQEQEQRQDGIHRQPPYHPRL